MNHLILCIFHFDFNGIHEQLILYIYIYIVHFDFNGIHEAPDFVYISFWFQWIHKALAFVYMSNFDFSGIYKTLEAPQRTYCTEGQHLCHLAQSLYWYLRFSHGKNLDRLKGKTKWDSCDTQPTKSFLNVGGISRFLPGKLFLSLWDL